MFSWFLVVILQTSQWFWGCIAARRSQYSMPSNFRFQSPTLLGGSTCWERGWGMLTRTQMHIPASSNKSNKHKNCECSIWNLLCEQSSQICGIGHRASWIHLADLNHSLSLYVPLNIACVHVGSYIDIANRLPFLTLRVRIPISQQKEASEVNKCSCSMIR